MKTKKVSKSTECNKKEKKSKSIFLNKEYVNLLKIVSKIEYLYKRKKFKDALLFINRIIDKLKISSAKQLSIFFDMTASILWKLGEKEKSYIFWKKSLDIDCSNRKSYLSFKLLFKDKSDIKTNYFFELFAQLKINEYISKNKNNINYNEIFQKIVDFWDKNFSSFHLESMDELELVEIFINAKVF